MNKKNRVASKRAFPLRKWEATFYQQLHLCIYQLVLLQWDGVRYNYMVR